MAGWRTACSVSARVPRQRVAGAALLALASAWSHAAAAAFTIGNPTPDSVFFVQGQSFTPSVPGKLGSGSAPASGIVLLDRFTIDYDTGRSTPFAALYLYASLPTTAAAASGVGALAVGSLIDDAGTYDFPEVPLDVSTRYFAVLPAPASVFDGLGDLYPGGVDLFDRPPADNQLDEGFGEFDLGFRAVFLSAGNPVPAPPSGWLVLAALGALAASRHRPAPALRD